MNAILLCLIDSAACTAKLVATDPDLKGKGKIGVSKNYLGSTFSRPCSETYNSYFCKLLYSDSLHLILQELSSLSLEVLIWL
jgi:hypothetical protein